MSAKRRGFIAALPLCRHKPAGLVRHLGWVAYPDLCRAPHPNGGHYPFDERDHSPWRIGRPAPVRHVLVIGQRGLEMFRFLIAPFQKASGSVSDRPASADAARQEFERLFRDDLAAHSQSIAQTRGVAHAADPIHA